MYWNYSRASFHRESFYNSHFSSLSLFKRKIKAGIWRQYRNTFKLVHLISTFIARAVIRQEIGDNGSPNLSIRSTVLAVFVHLPSLKFTLPSPMYISSIYMLVFTLFFYITWQYYVPGARISYDVSKKLKWTLSYFNYKWPFQFCENFPVGFIYQPRYSYNHMAFALRLICINIVYHSQTYWKIYIIYQLYSISWFKYDFPVS